jgi:Putative bacterial sensory transduction regulator
MSLFGDKQESNLKSCQKMIESVIKELGLDPDGSKLEGDDPKRTGWALKRGSAAVYVFLQQGDDANFLQVVSPVMKLPDQNLLPLYRRLLELNAEKLCGVAFGIKGEDVVLTTDRDTTDIDRSEVQAMITLVGQYADHFDDELVAEFGGVRHSDAGNP